MFKKHSIIVLVFILLFTFCFAGCKKNEETLSVGENGNNKGNTVETSSDVVSGGTVIAPNGEVGTTTEDGKGIIVAGTGSIPESRLEYGSKRSESSSQEKYVVSSPDPVVSVQSSSSSSSSNTTVPSHDITIKQFFDMSGEEQEKFIDSFPSISDFSVWFNAKQKAQEEEEKKNENYIVGDGSIDLRDYLD